MDDDGVALNDNCQVPHCSGEATEAKDENCSPAWLQLKTITTFDSEFSSIKSCEDTLKSPRKYHDSQSCFSVEEEVWCKTEFCEEKSSAKKFGQSTLTDSKMRLNFHAKHQPNLLSRIPDGRNSTTHIVGKVDLSKERLKLKRNRRRSRNGSISEGNSPNESAVDAVNNVPTSLNRHTNGTLSDAGRDYGSNGSCAPGSVQSLTRFSPTSLLVESLIDQLCKLMEKDSGKQKKLYHVICERLHQMQLIDDTYTIEEFQFMRSHYQRALYQLLAVAKSSTQSSGGRSILLPLPSSNVDVDIKINSEQVLEWSRYRHEYQELEYIAKGGFGHVYKVRNKLDGGQYAIKKIFLRYRYVEGFLRSLKEVKMLARLNHPNIVSYKAAWLEPLEDDKQKAHLSKSPHRGSSQDASVSIVSFNSSSSPLPLPPAVSVTTEDSIDIVFQDTSPDTDIKSSDSTVLKPNENTLPKEKGMDNLGFDLKNSESRFNCPIKVSYQKTSLSSADDSGTSISSDEVAVCPMNAKDMQDSQWNDGNSSKSTFLRNWATLYVQMQLCERTLRQWLDIRNSSLPAFPLASNSNEGILALNLFKKIVRGVEYIHSKGIVHHDIKPSNIFVDVNLKEVQVGDFGLSCCLLSRVDSTGVVGEHHGEVGTRMYAAPEQLRGKCTAKSDIYSLGVVLLELLQPFHTDMERSKVIQKVRAGLPPPELSTTWPHAARLMSDMLLASSTARPTAAQLLERIDTILRANAESDISSQLAYKDETIRLLKETVASRDQEIAELRKRLSLFEKQ